MLWIANRSEEWAEEFEPTPGTVCISITEPGRQANLSDGFDEILRLGFQDYDSAANHPKEAVLFTSEQAQQIVEFANKHRGKNILVHCAAGISRSGAVAESLLEAFPEYEDRGARRWPNGHVKSLLKRALGLVPLGWEEPRRFPTEGKHCIRFTEDGGLEAEECSHER